VLGFISALYHITHVEIPMWVVGGISMAILAGFALAWELLCGVTMGRERF